MLVLEHPFLDIDLFSAVVSMRVEMGPGIPANQGRMADSKFEQRHHRKARDESRVPGSLFCIDDNASIIFRIEVPKFHEKGTTGLRSRSMRRAGRVLGKP